MCRGITRRTRCDHQFESAILQGRVRELSVPERVGGQGQRTWHATSPRGRDQVSQRPPRGLHASVALDRAMMSLRVASRFGPLQWRSNSNSSRCAATAVMTAFAAALPMSRVEAAKIQRTITAEYICHGWD